jgi:rubrerythrin
MAPLMGINLASLHLQDALDLAILIEEEALERYEELREQLDLHSTVEAARFFHFMALNEEKHREELAAQRRGRFGTTPSRVTRAMLFEVEAPEFDEVRVFMTVREALQVALRAEKKAETFFAEALPFVRDPQVAALFAELRNEEIEHQQLVLEQIEKSPPEPAIRQADVADGPVGQ